MDLFCKEKPKRDKKNSYLKTFYPVIYLKCINEFLMFDCFLKCFFILSLSVVSQDSVVEIQLKNLYNFRKFNSYYFLHQRIDVKQEQTKEKELDEGQEQSRDLKERDA